MMSHALFFFLLISIYSTVKVSSASTPAYTATELILLCCGASTITTDISHRSWDSDQGSKYVPSNAPSISSASDASTMESSVFAVPYKTARVFHSPLTYTFPLSGGQKFIRLYFYPNIYSNVDTNPSLFSVKANAFTLFQNFSAFLHSRHIQQPAFMIEFIVNIGATQTLELIFTPNPNSSAFVNGIEIVSIPDKLFTPNSNSSAFVNGIKIVSIPDKLYFGEEGEQMNFENGLFNGMNVGGGRVAIEEDSGMFRGWSPDDDYIFCCDNGWTPHNEGIVIKYNNRTPACTEVYTSARTMTNISLSLEWAFPVDSRFFYLLRFHFCEFVWGIEKAYQRVFPIAINNQIADIEVDVFSLAGGRDIPIFRDYITWVPDDGYRGRQDLLLSLGYTGFNAFLNGLQIFKLNGYKRSFAASNPQLKIHRLPASVAVNPTTKQKNHVVIYTVVRSVISIVVVVTAVMFLIIRRQRKVKNAGTRSTEETSGSAVSLTSDICRYFSLNEIKTDDNFVIGRGGFGNVYKGYIDNAATTVAIKRLNSTSNQGASEFLTEIDMLSKLRHRNLVSLIGYCDDKGEMILVYDYMAHGTLRNHIYNSENSPLMWKQCLQICLGAAKGLDYLHSGTKHSIIHRDVKSTNILLDEKWVAKISDFGLSKMGPKTDSFTHISTNVKGTFGYLDPEYFSTCKLTRKSDVYAFGVVLFEVVSRRGAVDMRLEEEKHSLAGWARHCIREGKLDALIEKSLMVQISEGCLEAFVGIAGRCLDLQPHQRPDMGDVVKGLELAMTLQQEKHQVEEDVTA